MPKVIFRLRFSAARVEGTATDLANITNGHLKKIGACLHRANQIQSSHALSARGWHGTAWLLRFEPTLRKPHRKARSACSDCGTGSVRILPAKAAYGAD